MPGGGYDTIRFPDLAKRARSLSNQGRILSDVAGASGCRGFLAVHSDLCATESLDVYSGSRVHLGIDGHAKLAAHGIADRGGIEIARPCLPLSDNSITAVDQRS